MNHSIFSIIAVTLAVGCAADTSMDGEFSAQLGGSEMGLVDPSAHRMDDVWVFEYSSDILLDGILTGAPRIIDDCLTIDEVVVLWDAGHLEEARALIAAARGSGDSDVAVGGGSPSGSEATLNYVREVCPSARQVWLGAGGPRPPVRVSIDVEG